MADYSSQNTLLHLERSLKNIMQILLDIFI